MLTDSFCHVQRRSEFADSSTEFLKLSAALQVNQGAPYADCPDEITCHGDKNEVLRESPLVSRFVLGDADDVVWVCG